MKYLVTQSFWNGAEGFALYDLLEEVNALFIAAAFIKHDTEFYSSDHDFIYIESLRDFEELTTVKVITDHAAQGLMLTLPIYNNTYGNFINTKDYLDDQEAYE